MIDSLWVLSSVILLVFLVRATLQGESADQDEEK